MRFSSSASFPFIVFMMDSTLFPETVIADAPDKGTNISTEKPLKSFVEALGNVCHILASQLLVPCVKKDHISIAILENEYLFGVEACKHNLHGRILWPKGFSPLTVLQPKAKLNTLWIYVRRVQSNSSWNLNPGSLKLFPWSKDFIPNNVNHSSAQVWVRILGLPQEYWRPKIIFVIASSLGTPICIDSTSNHSQFKWAFGHFVRVLVDVDLLSELRDNILVERTYFAFFVGIE
ncbi:unnamed protein product [Lathyrus sativus]|nr:unnamed protein product [Lathyrus sativus]